MYSKTSNQDDLKKKVSEHGTDFQNKKRCTHKQHWNT